MVIHPVGVCQVVSSTIVPGRYRRCCGTWALLGPNRKLPAPRSRSAPNTLGESGRDRHSYSTAPFGATRQLCSQLDNSPYSAIGEKCSSVPQSVAVKSAHLDFGGAVARPLPLMPIPLRATRESIAPMG